MAKRYCRRCDRDTKHTTIKEHLFGGKANKGERLFGALISLGASELIGRTWIQCERCDHKREV